MSAKVIDGKAIAEEIRAEIKSRANQLVEEANVRPGLGVVLVGSDPASISYVTAKERACEENGIYSRDIRLPETTSEAELLGVVADLNRDPEIHGILVQLPLPDHVNEARVLQSIVPEKDVDGFHPVSLGKMMMGLPTLLPCTPHGIIQMLMRTGNDPAGKHAVVIGRSNIVGRPVATLLSLKRPGGNATVTVCHSRTAGIKEYVGRADIVIAAIGKPGYVKADMVKPGAVVIDVGVNRVNDATRKRGYRLVGDVDFEEVKEVASAITPVPGGVGPMTITMLLFNTVQAAEWTASTDSQ